MSTSQTPDDLTRLGSCLSDHSEFNLTGLQHLGDVGLAGAALSPAAEACGGVLQGRNARLLEFQKGFPEANATLDGAWVLEAHHRSALG